MTPQTLERPRNSTHLGTASCRNPVYEQITQRITDLLEAGTVPWRKPWKVKTAWPINLVSKKQYRGINVLLLLAMNYESPFWLTFPQAHQLGGFVRKGEKACPVVFWKNLKAAAKDESETVEPMDEKKSHFVARLYHVFNSTQCDGLKNIPTLPERLGTITEPIQILQNMPNHPVIKHGMRSAFYSPSEDVIGMPTLTTFLSEEEYWSALFHELTHSTGAESRLNRPSLTASAGFGSNPYCKEELIAEMGSSFLCGHAGIANATLNNSAAYLKAWLEKLRKDKTLIVSAAAQAQAATDYILGAKHESHTTTSAEGIQPE
jgi:antirestriction protein ArdC